MAEYIELEAAVKAFNNFDAGRADSPPCTLLTPAEFAEYLYELPTADVAPVVRCKDCKHKGWVQEPCHGKSVDYCKVWDCTLRNLETTFCSYGEKGRKGWLNSPA